MRVYYQDQFITLYNGDCRDVLPQLERESVQCVVTSPPYFGLRDYGNDDQIVRRIKSKAFHPLFEMETV